MRLFHLPLNKQTTEKEQKVNTINISWRNLRKDNLLGCGDRCQPCLPWLCWLQVLPFSTCRIPAPEGRSYSTRLSGGQKSACGRSVCQTQSLVCVDSPACPLPSLPTLFMWPQQCWDSQHPCCLAGIPALMLSPDSPSSSCHFLDPSLTLPSATKRLNFLRPSLHVSPLASHLSE